MTHGCVSKLTIISWDNGLSPGRCQAIIWTSAGILLILILGTNVSAILCGIHTFSFKQMHLRMSFGPWRPFCLGLNVLKHSLLSFWIWLTPQLLVCWLDYAKAKRGKCFHLITSSCYKLTLNEMYYPHILKIAYSCLYWTTYSTWPILQHRSNARFRNKSGPWWPFCLGLNVLKHDLLSFWIWLTFGLLIRLRNAVAVWCCSIHISVSWPLGKLPPIRLQHLGCCRPRG